jgi:hypothetical protein
VVFRGASEARRYCSVAFAKQVLPKFVEPGPWFGVKGDLNSACNMHNFGARLIIYAHFWSTSWRGECISVMNMQCVLNYI